MSLSLFPLLDFIVHLTGYSVAKYQEFQPPAHPARATSSISIVAVPVIRQSASTQLVLWLEVVMATTIWATIGALLWYLT